MKRNEGIGDRALRVLLGMALLALTIVGPQTWWGLIGFVPLLTGITGFCPLYRAFGLTTCRTSASR